MLTNDQILTVLQRSGMQQSHGGSWIDPIAFAHAVEREVRREALEEAAKVCGHLRWHPPWQMGAQECVDAVRALIDKEPRC